MRGSQDAIHLSRHRTFLIGKSASTPLISLARGPRSSIHQKRHSIYLIYLGKENLEQKTNTERYTMLEITCKGSPYEVSFPQFQTSLLAKSLNHRNTQIGHQHGSLAASRIKGSISFYSALFLQTTNLTWNQVQTTALDFRPIIQQNWPEYLEEMRGIADGAKTTLADILALNVRTEINFGLFSDGCTALSWLCEDGSSILAQNWDVGKTLGSRGPYRKLMIESSG